MAEHITDTSFLRGIDTPALLFAVLVLVLALAAMWYVRRLVTRLRDRRLARLERQQFHAVSSESPLDDPEAAAKRSARSSINRRYTIIHHTALVVIIALAALVAIFPMLEDMPQTVVSLLVAALVAVVGIAAKPLVENFISGVVISFSHHLRVGDTVRLDGDFYGTVEDITPTHTVVKLWDWQRYIVPNSRMLQKEVQNLTHKDNYLWAYVAFQVAYDADIEEVERIAIDVAGSDPHFAGYDLPEFWVRDMQPGTITCWVAGWVDSPEHAWYWRSGVRKKLLIRFRARGIRSQMDFMTLAGGMTQPLAAGAPSDGG